MTRLNDTRALVAQPIRGTDHTSLPDSGKAQVASERAMDLDGNDIRWRPSRASPAPDSGGHSLSSATGYLRGGIRQSD